MSLRFDLLMLNPDSHAELASALEGLDSTFVPELLELATDEDPKLQAIASWLLRRGIEAGLEFSDRDWLTWMANLGKLGLWSARLHFCQAFHQAAIPLTGAARETLEAWMTDDQPFVRAWAMSALVEDSCRQGGQEDRIEALVAATLADPAPSVRARARMVMRTLNTR